MAENIQGQRILRECPDICVTAEPSGLMITIMATKLSIQLGYPI